MKLCSKMDYYYYWHLSSFSCSQVWDSKFLIILYFFRNLSLPFQVKLPWTEWMRVQAWGSYKGNLKVLRNLLSIVYLEKGCHSDQRLWYHLMKHCCVHSTAEWLGNILTLCLFIIIISQEPCPTLNWELV